MIVNAKQTAIMRPTNTMSPACCCSGGMFARRFSKAFVLDISFANGAATTCPRYNCYKNCAAEQVTPSHYSAGGVGGFAAISVAFAIVAASVGCSAGSSNHSRQ